MIDHVWRVMGYLIRSRRGAYLLLLYLVFYVVFLIFLTQVIEKQSKGAFDKNLESLVNKVILLVDSSVKNDEKPDNGSLLGKIKVIYNANNRKLNYKLSSYGVTALLEDAYNSCIGNNRDENKSKSTCDVLYQLIQESKKLDPLYGLNFEQKLVFENLERELTNCNCTPLKGYIAQLKEVVRKQNKVIEELDKQKLFNWASLFSAALGVVGLVPLMLGAVNWWRKSKESRKK